MAPLVFKFLQFLLNPAGPACVFYFFFFPFACKDFCALPSKIKWTCFFLFLLSFWEEPASSHVFFWSSLSSVSCCFGAVNYGKSHRKKKLKNLLFKRWHTTCLSTASNASRHMPQFLFSLQVLHIHVKERIVCLAKDIWCCLCIYWLAANISKESLHLDFNISKKTFTFCLIYIYICIFSPNLKVGQIETIFPLCNFSYKTSFSLNDLQNTETPKLTEKLENNNTKSLTNAN